MSGSIRSGSTHPYEMPIKTPLASLFDIQLTGSGKFNFYAV